MLVALFIVLFIWIFWGILKVSVESIKKNPVTKIENLENITKEDDEFIDIWICYGILKLNIKDYKKGDLKC